ncbi:MAG: glycosyl hydrolase family 95 catalytic domain-containing protein [Planctomycetota bacterium]
MTDASLTATNPTDLTWTFPIARPHAGPLLGNGVQGVMVWGVDGAVSLTVGRAGFWDHRGGNDFTARTTYAQVRQLLEAGDEQGLRAAFGIDHEGSAGRPHQVGGGTLHLTLPGSWVPQEARLDLTLAEVHIRCGDGAGGSCTLVLRQAVDAELVHCACDPALGGAPDCRLAPSWEQTGEQLAAMGCEPPCWDAAQRGFLQRLPEDAGLALAYASTATGVALASALGGEDPLERALRAAAGADPAAFEPARRAWWAEYWRQVPRLRLPDPVLQEIYAYGLYKQGCVTPPHGLPCTLQGPFLEDYQLPPWSCDYHYNVNIQMIYAPALPTNCAGHFAPMWRLIRDWWPRLRANAAAFFENDEAVMLPHAVDDRCQVVGAFWTGSIDHACTAWMAQLAWLHYRYTLDEDVLREVAWPLLRGAFAGYRAMLEEQADGSLALPVSVSPEFKGSAMDAWGRNASFQLAAVHMLSRILPRAAAVLGEAVDPLWAEVARRLPAYTTIEGPRWEEYPHARTRRIALWAGQDLIGSHRHHSHLGAIFPFCTVEPQDPQHRELIADSLAHWVYKGPGAWSGWCVPWAAAIWARCGNPDAAVCWLHWWRENFVNEGRGTLHDAAYAGGSTLIPPGPASYVPDAGLPPGGRAEVMQLDAGFGALQAVCELLLQQRGDTLHVLPALPRGWRELDVAGLRAEGALSVDAAVRDGRVVAVRVHADKAVRARIAPHLGESCLIDGAPCAGAICELDLAAGQAVVLSPVDLTPEAARSFLD